MQVMPPLETEMSQFAGVLVNKFLGAKAGDKRRADSGDGDVFGVVAISSKAAGGSNQGESTVAPPAKKTRNRG